MSINVAFINMANRYGVDTFKSTLPRNWIKVWSSNQEISTIRFCVLILTGRQPDFGTTIHCRQSGVRTGTSQVHTQSQRHVDVWKVWIKPESVVWWCHTIPDFRNSLLVRVIVHAGRYIVFGWYNRYNILSYINEKKYMYTYMFCFFKWRIISYLYPLNSHTCPFAIISRTND